MNTVPYLVGATLANQYFANRLDKAPAKCDPRYGWEKGSSGKCRRIEAKGEKLFQEKFQWHPVKGEEAVSAINGSGITTAQYARDPEVVKIAIQRRYQDMLQATGSRMVIPKIMETTDNIKRIFRKKEAETKLIISMPETPLGKAYANSRVGPYKDAYKDDLIWAEKNKAVVEKSGLSPTEVAAIRDYARPGTYRLVNGIARQMPDSYYPPYGALSPYTGMPKEELEGVGSRTSKLVSGSLKKMPAYEGVTYRGLQLPDEAVQSLISSGKWEEKGFMSTTKDLSLAYPGNVVCRIYSNKGRDISSIEPLPNKEVLFPKKMKLKLRRYEKVNRLGKEFYIMDFVV